MCQSRVTRHVYITVLLSIWLLLEFQQNYFNNLSALSWFVEILSLIFWWYRDKDVLPCYHHPCGALLLYPTVLAVPPPDPFRPPLPLPPTAATLAGNLTKSPVASSRLLHSKVAAVWYDLCYSSRVVNKSVFLWDATVCTV